MLRYHATIFALIILLSVFSVPVYADDEKLPEVDCVSVGLGIDWGGLGINYLSIPEGSEFGFSAGAGYAGISVGYSVFVVGRLTDPDLGFLLGYGGADLDYWSLPEGQIGSVFLGFGNFPVDSGEFMWRLSLGLDAEDEVFPWVGIGVSL